MQTNSYSVLYPNGKPRCTALPLEWAGRAMRAIRAEGMTPTILVHQTDGTVVRIEGASDEVAAAKVGAVCGAMSQQLAGGAS